jgi:hypothetical protein
MVSLPSEDTVPWPGSDERDFGLLGGRFGIQEPTETVPDKPASLTPNIRTFSVHLSRISILWLVASIWQQHVL